MRKCEAKRTLLNYFLLPTTPVFKRRRDLTKSLGSFEFFLRAACAARLDLAIFDEDLRCGSFVLWSCSRISYKVQQGDAGRQGLQWLPCLTKLVTGGEAVTHHLRVPATTWWSLVPDCQNARIHVRHSQCLTFLYLSLFGCLFVSFFLSFFLYFFLSFFVCLFVCLFVCSFVRLFVCLCVHACVRACVHACVCSQKVCTRGSCSQRLGCTPSLWLRGGCIPYRGGLTIVQQKIVPGVEDPPVTPRGKVRYSNSKYRGGRLILYYTNMIHQKIRMETQDGATNTSMAFTRSERLVPCTLCGSPSTCTQFRIIQSHLGFQCFF